MKEYLKFVKWEGEYAYFEKARILEIILFLSGFYSLMRILGMTEVILIEVPKRVLEKNENKEDSD